VLAKTLQGVSLSHHTEAQQTFLLCPKGVLAHHTPEHPRKTHQEDTVQSHPARYDRLQFC